MWSDTTFCQNLGVGNWENDAKDVHYIFFKQPACLVKWTRAMGHQCGVLSNSFNITMNYKHHKTFRIYDSAYFQSGGDVASWIKSGEVGHPKFDPVTKEIIATHRNTSDVTQQKLNIRRQKNEASNAYHNDLQALVNAKQYQRTQERETEKQDSMKVGEYITRYVCLTMEVKGSNSCTFLELAIVSKTIVLHCWVTYIGRF